MGFTDEQRKEIVDILLEIDKHAGCGDHGCRFKRPVGMATNGGKCVCLERKPFVAAGVVKLYKLLAATLLKPLQRDGAGEEE